MKIYLQDDDEIRYYQSLGVTVHEGPRGGKFIYSEDLNRLGIGGGDFDVKTVAKSVFDIFLRKISGKKKVTELDDRVVISVSDEWGIYVTKSGRLGIWDERGDSWEIDVSEYGRFVIGFRILGAALNLMSDDRKLLDGTKSVFGMTDGLFDDIFNGVDNLGSYSYDKLKHSILVVSLFTGLKLLDGEFFNDDVKDINDLKDNIMLVFGPWVTDNVFRFEDGVDVNVDVFSSPDFYRHLSRMLLLSSVVGGLSLKINFVSLDTIRNHDITTVLSSAFYTRDGGREIFVPVDDMGNLKEYGYIGLMWHEFQHYLYDLAWSFIDDVAYLAFRLAMQGKLTDYAKTNDNEALSELFALVVEGLFEDDARILELYAGILQYFIGE